MSSTLTAIINGELYDPAPLGRQTVLIAAGRILKIGDADVRALDAAGLEVEVIDASGCVVTPGLIDPHEHLIGGSGEEGFATQTPEIALTELVRGGITTVVGCLGTDTVTRNMDALLAKAKGLGEEGLTALLWTGGYTVPPATLTGNVLRDMLLVKEVIGCGELAISDKRSSAPSVNELARTVKQCYVGGTLTGKAGVTHFHVGEETGRLQPIRALIDEFGAEPGWLYPTHVERTEALMNEAIEVTRRGVAVDVDTVELDLAKWLRYFLDGGGNPEFLTVSSDAAQNSPTSVLGQIRECIVDKKIVDLSAGLALVTRNTARVLKLPSKGTLRVGSDADLLVLADTGLELRDVFAAGRRLMADGNLVVRERFLEKSNRSVELHGQKG